MPRRGTRNRPSEFLSPPRTITDHFPARRPTVNTWSGPGQQLPMNNSKKTAGEENRQQVQWTWFWRPAGAGVTRHPPIKAPANTQTHSSRRDRRPLRAAYGVGRTGTVLKRSHVTLKSATGRFTCVLFSSVSFLCVSLSVFVPFHFNRRKR